MRVKNAVGRVGLKQVDTIEIPEEDGVADLVGFFSVFTHLREKESYRYLREAKRVLRKNGTIIISYLDPDIARHVEMAGKCCTWTQRKWWTRPCSRIMGRGVLNQLLSKKVLDNWSKELNLSTAMPCAPPWSRD